MLRLGLLRKRFLDLAVPVAVQFALSLALTQLDRLMIGQLGDGAIAGVGLAGQGLTFLTMVFQAMVSGCCVLVAQACGARRDAELGATFAATLWLNGLVSLVSAAAIYAQAPALIRLLGAAPDVVAPGGLYLSIEGLALPAIVTAALAGGTVRSLGDTRSTLRVAMASLGLKLVVNATLIFGFGPLPRLGITGAAIGGVVAHVFNAVALLYVLIWRAPPAGKRWPALTPRQWLTPAVGPMARVLPLLLPILGDMVLRQGAALAYSALLASVGTAALAAYQILMGLRSFAYIPVWGVRQATEITTGQALGRRAFARARVTAAEGIRLSVWMGVASGALLFAGAPVLVGLYNVGPTTHRLAVLALLVHALVQPFENLNVLLPAVLRVGGDVKSVAVLGGVMFWVVGVGGALVLSLGFHLGFAGVFGAICVESVLKSGVFWWRYRSDRWVRQLVK